MIATNNRGGLVVVAVLLLAGASFPADKKNEFRYSVAPGASITVVNQFGAITVQPAVGNLVVITATTHSDKVEVDPSRNGNRVEARTHILAPRVSDDDARVEYAVQAPPDATVMIRSATGPLTVEGLQGDVTIQGESAPVEVRNLTHAHLQVRTVGGAVRLTKVLNSYVDITSVGGMVTLNDVTGPKVTVATSSGAISYVGDFGAHGTYSLTNHSGNIDVMLPASASVDLTARSVSGSVQNDFPLQLKSHNTFAPVQGRALAGLANAGASAVRLSSFSGTITVKKQ